LGDGTPIHPEATSWPHNNRSKLMWQIGCCIKLFYR